MKVNYISILLIAVLALYCSCSESELQAPEEPTTATFMIGTRAGSDQNATEKELINSWWIAFVDESGIVTKIVQRPSDKTTVVERETYSLKIKAGKYNVYAFANIAQNTHGLNFTEGQKAPDLTAINWSEVGTYSESLVPMTGVLYNQVVGENKSFEIEVVRLWAKMRFQFITDSDNPVKVKKISMTPANTPAVTLLPDYSSLGGAPVLPAGTTCTTLERTTDITVTSKDYTTAQDVTFYLLESTAAGHPTGRYPLSFDLQYGEGAASRTVSALAYELPYINRNDFITIPVFITNWAVDISVLFYPPIGGYPAVITDSKDNEFYAKFASGGKFVIRPTVTSADGSLVDNSKLDISLTTEDAGGILSREPAYDNTTSEIIGEIGDGKTGTAVVTLEITIRPNESVQQTITRKIHIIRQGL